MELTNERKQLERRQLGVVALLLLWCIALIGYRIHISPDFDSDIGAKTAAGLLWNLFLASLPLVWSAGVESAATRKQYIPAAIFFGLWLIFLPNAPYLLTDLIHLRPHAQVPLWFLLAMFLSCAGTGTLFGYLSLSRVHAAVEQQFGKPVGWLVATGSLLLCAYGIYIGRFLRWNSWNALTHPLDLLKDLARHFVDSGSHPHPVAVTVVFGVGLILGYIAIEVMTTLRREVEPEAVTL